MGAPVDLFDGSHDLARRAAHFLDRGGELLRGRADLFGGGRVRRAVPQLLGELRQILRGRLPLLERLRLLLHGDLRFARCRGLLFGGQRDLLGAVPRFTGGPLRLQGGGQHILTALRDALHVLSPRAQRLDDDRGRVGLDDRCVRRAFDAVGDFANVVSDFFGQVLHALGILVRSFRERSHFVGHDGKAAPVVARSRRFDRSIERQKVGLLGDAADGLRDFADVFGASLEFGDDSDRSFLPARVALDCARRRR